MTPAIQVQGLEKSYKELQVLRGVDFEVARGSIFALLGSNGAGKTTVVKILSTLLKADSGTLGARCRRTRVVCADGSTSR
jgi:ABC-2 type transport system ATP-binding protein